MARGGGKPFHTVINAENYHALELLTYTHRHSIDAIYIDPPYNSGAKVNTRLSPPRASGDEPSDSTPGRSSRRPPRASGG